MRFRLRHGSLPKGYTDSQQGLFGSDLGYCDLRRLGVCSGFGFRGFGFSGLVGLSLGPFRGSGFSSGQGLGLRRRILASS